MGEDCRAGGEGGGNRFSSFFSFHPGRCRRRGFFLLFLDQEIDIMKEKEEREERTRENVNKRKISINS